MKTSILKFTILAFLFVTMSCNDGSEFVSGQFNDPSILISESDLYTASYFVNDEEVKIVVEDFSNTSDNRNDEYPALDYIAIKVDMNNNNVADNNVDKSYGISSSNGACMQFVLQDGAASTACMEEFGFDYEAKFSGSDKVSEDHLIYELVIRRENIFSVSDTVGLIFVLYGDDSSGSIPFLFSPLFRETIEFTL